VGACRTDAGIIAKMQAAVATAFASADLKKIWFEQGQRPAARRPRASRLRQGRDRKWGKVVRDGNITIE